MAQATLTISSKNYSSWSLRGWLLCKMSGIDFAEEAVSLDDPSMRAELLLLSPSMLVPCLRHDGLTIWNNIAIGEYLAETFPESHLLPDDRAKRARCRSISGEMHASFGAMRSALPMNIRGNFPTFKVWSRARADIERITTIWHDCLDQFGGPFLMGDRPCMADAMFAPVVTRLKTYHVETDAACKGFCDAILAMPAMQDWCEAAVHEPEDIDELEVEF